MIQEQYYLSHEEPVKSCLLALRSIILACDNDLSEIQKYGMPCFCYRKNIFCYLWTDKKTGWPYILMAEGQFLDHPGLLAGDRKRMKVFSVDPDCDLPVKAIRSILQAALKLYHSGMVKIKE